MLENQPLANSLPKAEAAKRRGVSAGEIRAAGNLVNVRDLASVWAVAEARAFGFGLQVTIFYDIIVSDVKTIILTAAAAKDLDALPPPAREQVVEALARFAVEGRGDVKRLTGRDGFRLRVGAYRVLFTQDMTTILAVYIGRRQTATYSRT